MTEERQKSDTPRTEATLNEVAAKWSQPEWQQKPVSMFMDEVSDFARQLERELAAARKDAARYRWLRDATTENFPSDEWNPAEDWWGSVLGCQVGGDFDAAIDAAMAADPPAG